MEIENIIESLLLVSQGPVSTQELANTIGIKEDNVIEAINSLQKDYQNRGLSIISTGNKHELVTNPKNAIYVSKFLNHDLKKDLTQSALEVLAIILYKQPITKGAIEEIRGVNSDQAVRNLMIRGLIEEKGRKETPGRPILYGTSIELLKYFGFSSEHDIPKIDEDDN